MTTEEAWRTWWDAEGKHMERLPHHDAVDHMASVTRIAWLNGAFGAAEEIERLRAELDRLGPLMLRAYAEIKQLRAEQDELRERLRRSNQALDSLAGYAAPE